jgi:hypothetical protein
VASSILAETIFLFFSFLFLFFSFPSVLKLFSCFVQKTNGLGTATCSSPCCLSFCGFLRSLHARNVCNFSLACLLHQILCFILICDKSFALHHEIDDASAIVYLQRQAGVLSQAWNSSSSPSPDEQPDYYTYYNIQEAINFANNNWDCGDPACSYTGNPLPPHSCSCCSLPSFLYFSYLLLVHSFYYYYYYFKTNSSFTSFPLPPLPSPPLSSAFLSSFSSPSSESRNVSKQLRMCGIRFSVSGSRWFSSRNSIHRPSILIRNLRLCRISN